MIDIIDSDRRGKKVYNVLIKQYFLIKHCYAYEITFIDNSGNDITRKTEYVYYVKKDNLIDEFANKSLDLYYNSHVKRNSIIIYENSVNQ